MIFDDKVKDKKPQYDINRETAKITALSSGWTEKYKFLTGGKILPSDQSRIIEQAKFTYFPLVKHFKNKSKQLKIKE